jgi:purine-nucleoside phosphorylase
VFENGWTIGHEIEQIRNAEYRLRWAGIEPAAVGLVLGSGLKEFAEMLTHKLVIPCHEIREFPVPRVPGHGGDLVQGRIKGTLVHCLSGRVHLYEGYHPWEVVRAVRTLALMGTRTFVLTNAAGGIRDDLVPGTLMLLADHINLTALNPLAGDQHEALGPRFPAMSDIYCRKARGQLKALDAALVEGVYAQMPGPSYETPSEIRMLAALGADAVGMSTVPEATVLHAMGCRVVGLSLITNRAAGLSSKPPDHHEVVAEGRKAAVRMGELLRRAIPVLANGQPARKKKSARRRR